MEIYQDRDKRLYNIKFCVIQVIVSLLILLAVSIFSSIYFAVLLAIFFFGTFILVGVLSFRFHFKMLNFKDPLVSITSQGIYNYTAVVNKGFHAWSDIDSAIYIKKGFTKTIELSKSGKHVTTIFFDSILTDPQQLLKVIHQHININTIK